MMCSSSGFWFFGGNIVKYALLFLGFILILNSCRISGKQNLAKVTLFSITLASIFVLFLAFSWIRNHQIFQFQNLIFIGIIYSLMCCGFVFGLRENMEINFSRWQLLVLALLIVTASGMYAMKANEYSFHTVNRSIGVEGVMSPVGLSIGFGFLAQISILFVLFGKTASSKLIFVPACLAGISALVLTATRGPLLWLGLFNSFLVSIIIWRSNQRMKIILTIFAVAILGFVGVVLVYKFDLPLADRVRLMEARILGTFSPYGYIETSERDLIWLNLANTWESWIVFGQKNYRGYPHNQFLEWTTRFGLIGLAVSFLSLLSFLYSLFKLKTYEFRLTLGHVILGLFCLSFLISMLSMPLEHSRFLFLGFGYVLGVLLSRTPHALGKRY